MAERYKMTLTWMDALVSGTAGLQVDQTGADVIEPIALAFEKVADAYLGGLVLTDTVKDQVKVDYCETARALLPTLPSPPYATASGKCQ